MSAENPSQLCVYCGTEEATTDDHIPPKLLLAKPYPENLLTVPACLKCNQSFQDDDEYTRFTLGFDLRVAKQPAMESQMPAIRRSLERPQAQGFSKYLVSQMSPSAVLGADGKPLGWAMEIDQKRVNTTGGRIVRGLYFRELGKLVPADKQVKVACDFGMSPSHPLVLQFARVYQLCPDRRDHSMGDAFSYVAGIGPNFSTWLLILYDSFGWIATVDH
jgi:hypothetical protein